MRRRHGMAAVLLLAGLLGLAGCGRPIAGRYLNSKDQSAFLQLEKDGSFSAQINGKALKGSYYIAGSTVVLRMVAEKKVVKEDQGRIEGKVIIDGDGVRWTRQ